MSDAEELYGWGEANDDNYATIRCNMCYKLFRNDDDLACLEDEDGEFKGCPVCKTDSYLMDLDEPYEPMPRGGDD